MRIGILTLPLHLNYGGILQAYALQTILEKMGHDVVVFQTDYYGYKKKTFIESFILIIKRTLYKMLVDNRTVIFWELKKKKNAVRLWKNTDLFISRHIHALYIKKLHSISLNSFDTIIVGSDQIWRPEYVNRMWNADICETFLRFTSGYKIKRISYAASFGVDTWLLSKKETRECKCLAQLFEAISVREDSGVKLCAEKLGVEAKHVLDPTMLLTKDDYINLIEKSVPVNESSLFCYILDETVEKSKLVSRIASDKNMTIFRITINRNDVVSKENYVLPPIEQWLKCILESSFIVTDSFHGCVFSILFGKPFVAIANINRGLCRFDSLLRMFELEKHLLLNCKDYQMGYSYSITDRVVEKLDLLRHMSMIFLRDSLAS